MVAGPAPPRWRPLYVQRQDSEQENAYENVGAAAWWWRGRAQTLEFHSRAPVAGVLRVRGVRVAPERLSASCAAIDAPCAPCPPCLLLLPRPRASCSYHVLPEAQRPRRRAELEPGSTESDDD